MSPDHKTNSTPFIDDIRWAIVAGRLELPDSARTQLEDAIAWAQTHPEDLYVSSTPPSEVRRELTRLHRLASELESGLQSPSEMSSTSLRIAQYLEKPEGQRPIYAHFAEARTERLLALQQSTIRQTIAGALELAQYLRPSKGNKSGIGNLVARIDHILLDATGKGLVRSSMTLSKRDGRAQACRELVTDIVRKVVGPVPDATIDDAIKKVIARRRRSVGKA